MTFELDEDQIRCIFSGKLDSRACDNISRPLNDQLTGFLKNRDAAYVVFDLKDVRYVSTVFLRLCLFHCKQVGVKNFRVEHPCGEVNRVFQIAGFTDVMTIV